MTEPSFPLHPGTHAEPSLVEPAEHVAQLRLREPDATLSGLAGVVLIYQRSLLAHATTHYPGRPLTGWVRAELHRVEHDGHLLGVCGAFGLGAPAAALVTEQLIALGAPRIVTLGTAATLQHTLHAGDLVVCDRALADVGVARHYAGPRRDALPAPRLTAHLHQTLQTSGTPVTRGATWSTDALYRETAAEVMRYSADGVLTADMEAAGVFAVATHRKVEASAVFAVADSLVNRRPRADLPDIQGQLRTALRSILAGLAHYGEASGG
ncbi:nucleoside phosphorylase [Streptomyces sp. NPDC001691]|uniref:nucleoside phosphorylase n=1 Tax=Streptomyces sp. NPDC001691 TaxID=3364600 RepID=UPI00367F44C6